MAANLIPSMSGFWRNGGVGNGNYVASQSGITLEADVFTVRVAPSTEYKIQAFTDGWDNGVYAGLHQLDGNGAFLSDSGWKNLAGGYTFTTLPNAEAVRLVVRPSSYPNFGMRNALRVSMGDRVRIRMSETPFDSWEPASAEGSGGGGLND